METSFFHGGRFFLYIGCHSVVLRQVIFEGQLCPVFEGDGRDFQDARRIVDIGGTDESILRRNQGIEEKLTFIGAPFSRR